MAGFDASPGKQHEDLGGWVLGALDPGDAERFRRHLKSCQQCRTSAAELAPTARLLNFVAPKRATSAAAAVPPEGLLAHTLDRVRAAARKSSWRRRTAWLGSAAAAAAVVAGGTVAALSIGSSAAYAYELQPQNGSVASGKAIVTHTDGGWAIQMSARHLKPLPRNEYYQCWWAKKTTSHPAMISGGSFTVGSAGSAAVTMNMAGDPDDYSVMEITVQDADSPGQIGRVVLEGIAQDSDLAASARAALARSPAVWAGLGRLRRARLVRLAGEYERAEIQMADRAVGTPHHPEGLTGVVTIQTGPAAVWLRLEA
jgi:hypothetical protein